MTTKLLARMGVYAAGYGLALGLAAAPCLAQQAKPALPAAPPAATAPVSPSHLALASEVVELSGITRSFSSVVPQFAEQIKQMFGTTRPEIAGDHAAALTQLAPEFEAQKVELVNATNLIMAQMLSEADLKDIAAFLRSPAGARYVDAQPRIVDQLFGQMELWSRRLSEYMITRVRAELKKKNIDI